MHLISTVSLGEYLGGPILKEFLAEALRIGPAAAMQPHPQSHSSESAKLVDKKLSAAREG